eukprot:CAMPEP_0117023310 /NCGR_PEP_ID=MMETSP0472-20121206/17414_1 /TAXON_ID=693140 ORGANISM="Tiarina fusus, Strain LIS" /NCGR_SAMPLE_ID=MMETSP0472 /ASSEMBLY_ACC=CAM_ASM_000603 /LENGTH=125 /DNA_ID=CAMNT_0004729399 /DNA_START=1049 /DNA_END=1423 /DNA_ORIENTATION=+
MRRRPDSMTISRSCQLCVGARLDQEAVPALQRSLLAAARLAHRGDEPLKARRQVRGARAWAPFEETEVIAFRRLPSLQAANEMGHIHRLPNAADRVGARIVEARGDDRDVDVLYRDKLDIARTAK